MNDRQWVELLQILDGQVRDPLPCGFLVDGPWVTGLNGIDLMDYFVDQQVWLEANLAAAARYPEIFWLPGFWAEYGMISNPPSFGAKCIWQENGFPTCAAVLGDYDQIDGLAQPNVRSDGLLPLIVRRLERARDAMETSGHRVRFATAHGPLTIGSYLMDHTNFFLGMREAPDAIHRLLDKVTRFIIEWLCYQKERFPSIDGLLVLDDLLGFVGDRDFQVFALPRMRQIFSAVDCSVRFLHNDANGLITARYLERMNVNLFNFSFEHDIHEIRQLAGDGVTLMGNVPPRDVLGRGTADDVRQDVRRLVDSLADKRRVILSAGGFTPPQFTDDKIRAFRAAAERSTR